MARMCQLAWSLGLRAEIGALAGPREWGTYSHIPAGGELARKTAIARFTSGDL